MKPLTLTTEQRSTLIMALEAQVRRSKATGRPYTLTQTMIDNLKEKA